MMLDLARGSAMEIGRQDASYLFPVWSPDGTRIAYDVRRGGNLELAVRESSGAGPEQLVLENGRRKAVSDWSRDGRWLIYSETAETGIASLWTLDLKGAGKPEHFLPEDFDSRDGAFSPDGHWVAYDATESPVQQVYVQSFPPGRGKWQISSVGGSQPRWRRDGRELFYVDPGEHA